MLPGVKFRRAFAARAISLLSVRGATRVGAGGGGGGRVGLSRATKNSDIYTGQVR